MRPSIQDRERAKLWLLERMPHRYFVEVDVIALATEFEAVRRETLTQAAKVCDDAGCPDCARDLTIGEEST